MNAVSAEGLSHSLITGQCDFFIHVTVCERPGPFGWKEDVRGVFESRNDGPEAVERGAQRSESDNGCPEPHVTLRLRSMRGELKCSLRCRKSFDLQLMRGRFESASEAPRAPFPGRVGIGDPPLLSDEFSDTYRQGGQAGHFIAENWRSCLYHFVFGGIRACSCFFALQLLISAASNRLIRRGGRNQASGALCG